MTGEGEVSYTWALGPDDFFSGSGAPIDVGTLEVGLVDSEEAGFGLCGRCLVPGAAPPQVIFEGDRCPIPA